MYPAAMPGAVISDSSETATPVRQRKGIVACLLGPDGMGKSTQAVELERYFSERLKTRLLYMGNANPLIELVQRLRAERRVTGSAKPKTGVTAHVEDMVRAVLGLWIGISRLGRTKKARRLADRGYLVICDRWPQSLERGMMDGPIRRKTAKTWAPVEALFKLEEQLYRRMDSIQPDVSCHLTASFEVSEARKPGDITRPQFERRIALLDRMQDETTVSIDASGSTEQVRDDLIATLWDGLSAKADQEVEHEPVLSKVSLSIGGQAIYALGQLVVLAAMSHLHGVEAVGMFGLALAIVTPSFVIANLGLRTVQSIDQEDEFSFSEYAGFRLFMTLAALVICTVLGTLLASEATVLLIILLYALAKSFEAISDMCYGQFEQMERFEKVFRSNVTRSIATAIVFVGLLLFGAPLWIAFLAQVVVWAAVALAMDVPALRQHSEAPLRPSISRARFWQLLKRSIPFGGRGFLTGLQPSLMRIFVESALGLAALGVFTNIMFVFQAGANLGNALRHFMGPRFARLRVKGDMAGTRRIVGMIGVGLAVCCAAGLALVAGWGEPLLRFVFGSETAQSANLLMLVAAALAVRLLSTIPTSLLYAHRHEMGQFWREFVYVALVLALGSFVISEYGLLGAGWLLVAVSTLRLLFDGVLSLGILEAIKRPTKKAAK